jgi:hypothetical protein
MRVLGLVLALCLVMPVAAQSPVEVPGAAPSAIPTLTREQQMQIEILELRLRIVQLEAEAYIRSLARDGFMLQRGPEGRWGYAAQ